MQSTRPMTRTAQRWTRHAATAAVLVAALALALPGQARPRHGHHGCGGSAGSAGLIEQHAEELGIDEATREEIREIADASREEAEAIHAERRQAHDVMRDLLEQDAPDVDAVMKQAEVIGEIDVRKHKQRIATMLNIRAVLTPAQRSALRAMKDEMRGPHGKRGGCPHCGGESCRGDGPPPPEAL